MKVRRYLAPDMRTALAAARREQGADVLILSQRRVEGGLELITADEYDEALVAAFAPRLKNQEQAAAAPSATTPAPVTQPVTAAPAAVRQPPTVEVAIPTVNAAVGETLWTREPVIEQMRGELKSLRGLLQQQFAALAWSDLGHAHPLWASLLRKAVHIGISVRLARDLVREIPEDLAVDQGWRRLLALYSKRLGVEGDALMTQGGAAALVGPTGVGKTTLIAKLAARFALAHGIDSVALITADGQRIAAHEQLRSFGRILGIPVRVVGGTDELRAALDSAYDRRLVLVDTAGISHRDARLGETLAALRACSPVLKTYVTLSAATQGRDLEDILGRYAPARPAAVMLTKLDETHSLAPALSAAILNRLPVAYVSGGQRIPEDCEAAKAHSLVSRAVAMVPAGQEGERNDTELMMEELFDAGAGSHAGP